MILVTAATPIGDHPMTWYTSKQVSNINLMSVVGSAVCDPHQNNQCLTFMFGNSKPPCVYKPIG